MTEPALTIPGLDDAIGAVRPAGLLERAAVAQIEALRRANRLTSDHTMVVALVLELAATISASRGKAAGVAMASRQLLDALDKLPQLTDGAEANEWAEIVAALGPPAVDEAS